MMKNFYHGFDGLDISFQGAFPSNILEQLEAAKTEAQERKQSVLIKIGKTEIPVMVAESGTKNHAYRFDTGIDGMIWFVSKSTKSDLWNLSVSVHSLCLALHGYYGAKERIINFLKDIEAIGPATRDKSTNKIINFPLENISRIDYCFDFWTDTDFIIDPNCISAHSRANRKFNGKDFFYGAKGKNIESVTIGTMPSRQVTIYNKTKEIQASSKSYWNDIWKEHISEKLNGKNFNDGIVWRVEVRAGKEELKKWNIRRFEDLEKITGDTIKGILSATRYVTPTHDKNPSRWPTAPFWQDCLDTTSTHLSSFMSGAIRKRIIKDKRENIIKGYDERTIGNLIGLCAATNCKIEDLPDILDTLKERLIGTTGLEKQILREKLNRVNERISFIE